MAETLPSMERVNKELRIVLDQSQIPKPAHSRRQIEDVFIIYGDNISPDDRVQTNYDGEYEFMFLRPGKYTKSIHSLPIHNSVAVTWDEDHMTILQEIEIYG
jgi:hypothetical protein